MGVLEAYLMLANTNVNSLAPRAPSFVTGELIGEKQVEPVFV